METSNFYNHLTLSVIYLLPFCQTCASNVIVKRETAENITRFQLYDQREHAYLFIEDGTNIVQIRPDGGTWFSKCQDKQYKLCLHGECIRRVYLDTHYEYLVALEERHAKGRHHIVLIQDIDDFHYLLKYGDYFVKINNSVSRINGENYKKIILSENPYFFKKKL